MSGARIVLLRPRSPENLGAVARALANFGLDDWAVVSLGTHDFAAARRVAVHAEALLDRPRVVSTLDEAVADCAWVVGTSSRRVRGRRRYSPREVARRAAELAPARTALVFGDERSGLTNDEVLRCHDLSAVPTAEAQPSLNLAQAVLVYAYELRAAAAGSLAAERAAAVPASEERGGAGAPVAGGGGAAVDGEVRALEAELREVLRGGGFLRGPERHAVRDLLDGLRRARLSAREVALWRAALRQVARTLRGRALDGRAPR